MSRRHRIAPRPRGLVDDPQWYKDAIIYEVRVRSFFDSNDDGIGDFRGLASKLDYLQDLGVTALWLLPFYASPLRDDGYDISDYTDVHPDVGTLADFETLLAEAHRRGIRVITELVLNHTSDQHPWFKRARAAPPGSPERAFYVWSTTPDRYRDARIIFKDFETSNWTWDQVAEQYYWHRFYSHQPDLNFENPEVQAALFEIVDFWLKLGVDGLRLDAVPYLYEEEGTTCENLPRTHEFLQKLRRHVDERFANRMLLAEANQWPQDAAAYFGDGTECHMNFHFPIMPRMFMSIHMEDRLPIIDILAQTPSLHSSCQWALFLRNHDELTLEMVTDEERDYMYRAYAHEAAMRVNLGIRRRLAPLVGNDRRRMELLNGLLFSLPGTPVLYYGDEIGMGDNVFLGDRNGVRTPMQWTMDRNAGFSRASPQRLILPINIEPEYHYESLNVEAQQGNPNSLLWWTKHLISLRKEFRAFGRGTIEFLNPANMRVLAFVRQFEDETILVVANLSRNVQFVELDLSKHRGSRPLELFGRTRFPPIGDAPYLLTLSGHAFYWFSLERTVSAEDEGRVSSFEVPTIVSQSVAALLRGDDRYMLEDALASFVRTRLWHRGRADVASAKIRDVVRIGPDDRSFEVALVELGSETTTEVVALPLTFVADATTVTARPGNLLPIVALFRTMGDDRPTPGAIVDASDDPAYARVLLESVAQRARARGSFGEIVAEPLASDLAFPGVFDAEPRPLGAPGNMDVVVQNDDRFVLRLFREVDEGTSPDLELGRFLTERGFAHTPAMVAAIEYRRPRAAPMTLGVVRTYVPNAGRAWSHALDEISRFYERVLTMQTTEPPPPPPSGSPALFALTDPPAVVRNVMGVYRETVSLLGQRTAELHRELASGRQPTFVPEPYSLLDRRSKYQSLRNLSGVVLRQLRAHMRWLSGPALDDARFVLAHEHEILRRFEPLLTETITSLRIRCHGNFHLDQVLHTGTDFVFVNFDGGRDRSVEERRRKRSPLRDLAGMLRSFDFAAFVALLGAGGVREADRATLAPWAHIWSTWTSAAFLAGYYQGAANARLVPDRPEQLAILLDAYVLEKALFELRGEIEERDDAIVIPLQAIAHMLGAQEVRK